MTDLNELLERVRGSTGPDRELDRAIGELAAAAETTFPQYEPDGVMPLYTGSIDAATALVAAKLPGWLVTIEFGEGQPCAMVLRPRLRRQRSRHHRKRYDVAARDPCRPSLRPHLQGIPVMSKENRVSDERLAEMIIAAKHDAENQLSDRYKAEAEMRFDILAELQSLRSKPVAGVSVKPLEWEGDEAKTAFGIYRVYRTDDGYGVSFEHVELVHVGFNSVGAFESPRDNAISYAQPDYRQRILSALSLPAQEPVAWQHKLTGVIRQDKPSALMGLNEDYTPLYASPQPEAVITEEMVERVLLGVLDCPHTITGQEIILRYAVEKEGRNATNQLRERITAALKEAGNG